MKTVPTIPAADVNLIRVRALRTHPHVVRCDCCGQDLDVVEEDPAGWVARILLTTVEARCRAWEQLPLSP
jgi:hypothetical protein